MFPKKAKKFLGAFIALSALSLTATGCKGHSSSGSSSTGTNGTVRVLLTDDPIPYRSISHIYVTISEVDVHSESSGWIYASLVSQTVDALGYRNGLTAILSSTSLSTQTIDKVRLAISSVEVDTTDGRSFFPSLNSSVVNPGTDMVIATKINMVAGINNDVLVDLNLAGSLAALGDTSTTAGITGFTFNPVMRAVDTSTTGSIDGVVSSDNGTLNITTDDFALSNVQVNVFQGNTLVASGITDSFGYYKIIGLMPGSYAIQYQRAYNVTNGGYFDEFIPGLFVVQGLVLSQDATMEEMPASWI